MPAEFIYTAYKLARHYPPDRTVLEDISISFYPGAKIGVIGPNGAGKSSLLRIMAGARRRVHRRGPPDAGLHGRLPEPGAAARPGEGRQGQRRSTASAEVQRPASTQYNAVMAKWSEPGRRLRGRSAPSRPRSRTRSTRPTPGTSSATSTSRWTRCAARPTTPTSRRSPAARSAASRSAGCCSSTPTCSCSTSRPTTSTPSRSSGSSASSSEYAGTVVAVTHDRYFLDNVAKWILELDRGRGHPVRGQLLELARAEARAAGRARRSRSTPASARSPASSSGCGCAPKARQAKGKARLTAYEQLLAEANDAKDRRARARDRDPAGPAPRRHGHRGRGPAQGLRRPPADRGPDVLAAARRHRRHHRARTAPARRRCSG